MPEENNKKVEHFKRVEIRTMEKDLSRLREAEARKERERIAKLKTEEETREEKEKLETAQKAAEERKLAEEEAKKRAEIVAEPRRFRSEEEERRKFLERVEAQMPPTGPPEPIKPPPEPSKPPAPTPEPPKLFEPPPEPPKIPLVSGPGIPRILPRRPSSSEKLWIRVVISLLAFALLAMVFTFWYWYLAARGKPTPPIIEKPPQQEEISVPPALIPVQTTKTLKISHPAEIPSLISQTLKKDLPKEKLVRILIQNKNTQEFLGLKDFLGAWNISPPQGFYESFNNEFTLFINTQKEGGRLGFITTFSEEAGKDLFSQLMKDWEPKLEEETALLFGALDKKKPALVPYFRNASYQGVPFRYQTFSTSDLGICYGLVGNYFIFTSSWDAMEKTIKAIEPAPAAKNQIPGIPLATPAPGNELIISESILFEEALKNPPPADSVSLPILRYHHIGQLPDQPSQERRVLTVSLAAFEKQMQHLAQKYQAITFQELIGYFNSGKKVPKNAVIITFDDGWKNQYQYAFPILKKYGLKATFFVVVNYLDAPSFMSWKEVREIAKMGMEIGSHSMSHANLVGLDEEDLQYEIETSKKILEKQLGTPVYVFAYPYGSFNGKVTEAVKKANYLATRSTIDGFNQSPKKVYSLQSIRIYDSLDQFKNVLGTIY